MEAPKATRKPHVHTMHGHQRHDNYFWLRERENPEVIEYLNAENAYTAFVMQDTVQLQETLFQEMKGRMKQTDMSVPYRKHGYWYYTRYEEGKEYPIHCRKFGDLDQPEELLLDVNQLAEGQSFCQVGGISMSPDLQKLIYGVDFVGRRQFKLFYKDLKTGEIQDLQIENTAGSAVWAADNETYFFTAKDPITLRTDKIYRNTLSGNSVLVFHEIDETYNCYVGKSKSEAYIIIGCHSTLTSEMLYLKSDNPNGSFQIFLSRENGHEYSVAHYQDKWLIHTNWQAKNFRLMECSLDSTRKENWKEIIPHREDVLLEGMELFDRFMVLEERGGGLTQLRVIEHENGQSHLINFGEETYSAWSGTNPEYDTQLFRFGYTSLVAPSSVYEYDMKSRTKVLLKQQEVVGGYSAESYMSERHWVTSHDGVKVPLSLVYRKDLKSVEGNPLLLYGYGSYGHSMDPYFSSNRLSLLDRGFVFALAHIRGGEDLGRAWYEEGRQLKKKNTFFDFIACAEYLKNQAYANRLYAMGGSAGGLLMGAIINMRPDLWKGVIAQVPFVDVVTTMLDESIPLTTGEYDEWGNPNEKEYYEYILSYSPFDQVEAKDYPNLLVTTGLHDSQVQYWEPAKWVAKLRELKTDQNLLLLHTNMEVGHGGASGRFEQLRELALEYAFLLKLEGMKH